MNLKSFHSKVLRHFKGRLSTRPLLLTSIGRLTRSGRQKKMIITSQHGWAYKAKEMLTNLNRFFSRWKVDAPQLGAATCWQRIINAVKARFAHQKGTGPPALTMI